MRSQNPGAAVKSAAYIAREKLVDLHGAALKTFPSSIASRKFSDSQVYQVY
jgi:hypothetical protein